MAKSTADVEKKEEAVAATESQQEQAQQPQAQAIQLQVEDKEAICAYANFCRVTGSPEELIVDFGLNPQPMMTQQKDPIHIKQRIVVNFYTAKRLLHALQLSVQRHEQVFGVLETDVRKRVNPQGQQQQQAQQQAQADK